MTPAATATGPVPLGVDVVTGVLAECARTVLGDFALPDVLTRLVEQAVDVLALTGAAVLLTDDDGGVHPVAVSAEPAHRVGPGAARGASAERGGEPLACAYPVTWQGEALGTLELRREPPGELSGPEAHVARTLADVAAAYVVSARSRERARRAAEEAQRRSLTDPLTQLPNRTLFLDHLDVALARTLRGEGTVAVLFVDLDRFKQVNDRLGHAAGDQLLVEVAERLRAVIRPSDTAARLGGDEFAVLCADLEDVGAALAVAHRILDSLAPPVLVEHREVSVDASIGVASGRAGSTHAAALLADADAAMYRAKQEGRGRVELFDSPMRARALARRDMQAALHLALAADELRLHYQPVVEVESGLVVGVEALLRWTRPQDGLVLPGEFLRLAEETHLIEAMGDWVLDEACRQAAWWHRRWAQWAPQVSVNLSARQLRDARVVDVVASALMRNRLPAAFLSLEVTEEMLVQDAHSGVSVLHALRTLGVGIAVDDFGTGSSSLACLASSPVDRLKVDPSLVRGLHRPGPLGTGLVQAVVNLGHTLGMQVVAEGVETGQQLAALRRLGCDAAQGHLFSPGIGAEEVTGMLGVSRCDPPAGDVAS